MEGQGAREKSDKSKGNTLGGENAFRTQRQEKGPEQAGRGRLWLSCSCL